MKMFLSSILALCLIVGFSSCQKEADFNTDGIVNNNNDSIITRIFILDTTFSTGTDTVEIVDFTYDASGRLLKYNDIYFNTGVSGAGKIDGKGELIYEYNGTAIHPDVLKETYSSFLPTPETHYTNSYLTYTNGYISKDSCARDDSWYETKFFTKLSPTRIKVVTATGNFIGSLTTDTCFVQLEFQNGNLIKETDSLYQPGTMWNVVSLTTTYDTKTNPFIAFSLPYLAPFIQHHPIDIGTPEFFVPSENNILKQTNGRGFIKRLTAYEYGVTGLPKIARNESSYKVFYLYKKA